MSILSCHAVISPHIDSYAACLNNSGIFIIMLIWLASSVQGQNYIFHFTIYFIIHCIKPLLRKKTFTPPLKIRSHLNFSRLSVL